MKDSGSRLLDPSSIFGRYLNQQKPTQGEDSSNWLRIIFCTAAYIGLFFLQVTANFSTVINGILSQFMMIISVYLAVSSAGVGYLVGLILNFLCIILILVSVFVFHNTVAIPGLFVSFFTMVSITIITVLNRLNARQFAEVVKQKKELIQLNEEVSASEEELRQQNEQLLESFQTIQKHEEKLNHLAYFDTLTELPNRKMFLDRLDLLVRLSLKNDSSFAVVFIDLDNFKKTNDTLGHYIGDLLILSVASRLKPLIREKDMLGRLGGDEFALIIQQKLKDDEIFQYVDSLRVCLEEKFLIEGFEIAISASFGISLFPQDGSSPNELIKRADTAMYKAKETGKNGIYFFSKEMQDEIFQKIDFENKLVSALQNKEFFLVFQPQFYVAPGKLRGFEALVRWQSAEWGVVCPMKFIPLAEETGLIIPMGKWILRTACQKFKEMLDQYHFDAIISVNISAVQFEEPGFVQMVQDILQECDLPASCLELEITESVLIKSLDNAIRILEDLKKTGVRIALDDFGTGYSSLHCLQLLPIDTLKIDKSFVDHINNQNNKKQIIGSIISLVHQIDILVVAEGVENEAQLEYLKKENCDGIQGFLLGRPLNFMEIPQFLEGLV